MLDISLIDGDMDLPEERHLIGEADEVGPAVKA